MTANAAMQTIGVRVSVPTYTYSPSLTCRPSLTWSPIMDSSSLARLGHGARGVVPSHEVPEHHEAINELLQDFDERRASAPLLRARAHVPFSGQVIPVDSFTAHAHVRRRLGETPSRPRPVFGATERTFTSSSPSLRPYETWSSQHSWGEAREMRPCTARGHQHLSHLAEGLPFTKLPVPRSGPNILFRSY